MSKLTPTELLKINLIDMTEQLEKSRQDLKDKDLELVKAKLLILQGKLELAKKDLTEATQSCYNTGSLTDASKARKNYLQELAEKYELEGVWGYDPQTGEII